MTTPAKPLILCVDDDADLRTWMELLLIGHGWDVVTADCGAKAIEVALQRPVDLILLDVTMPDLSGYEVCSRLQDLKAKANIPVIFVTALDGERDKVRAFQVGAADYLVKPIREQDLRRLVDLHLGTSRTWKALVAAPQPGPREPAPAGSPGSRWDDRLRPAEFRRFKELLGTRARLSPAQKGALGRMPAPDLYPGAAFLRIPERLVTETLADFLSIPFREHIDPAGVKLGVLPVSFCRTNGIVPVAGDSQGPAFVLSNPFTWEVQEAVKRVTGRHETPTFILAEPAGIRRLLTPDASMQAPAVPAPSRRSVSISELEGRLEEEYALPAEWESREVNSEDSAPLIQLVNGLIESAHAQGASDIHLEPGEDEVRVRFRVDGDLRLATRLKPARLIHPLIARIKIMAKLDIAEHRLPQDGRIVFKNFSPSGADFDLRVAIAPQNHGEKAVLRIIDKQKSLLPLADLGFSARNLEIYKEKIRAPYGMVLHVGPTGSGKSMTLYAALNELKDPTLNIQTAEDPVEYTLPGINQLQIHKEIGLTFPHALRSFLRLDPDVILVGEIRDRETADTAIEASLTGHLLLSTMHTNDACSTVIRFLEMGVEPYMISSSLVAVCAQRLLRRLCPACKEAYRPDASQLQLLGDSGAGFPTLYRPKGCDACGGTGYQGRIGVHEVLVPDDAFKEAANEKGITAERLKSIAVRDLGMTTLYQDAMDKVRQGLCSMRDALGNLRPDAAGLRADRRLESRA